jgi:hypothetical protein
MRTIVNGFVGWALGLLKKEEFPMRKSAILTMATMLVVGAAVLPTPASAADVSAIVAACDSMAAESPGSCSYSVNKDSGDISGCITKNSTCFYCPADGKHQCSQTTFALPKEKATPADSGVVQERAVRQGGGLSLGYDCSTTECTCTGDADCDNMFRSGKCTGTIFDSFCDTSKPVVKCTCYFAKTTQPPKRRFLPIAPKGQLQVPPKNPVPSTSPVPQSEITAPVYRRGVEGEPPATAPAPSAPMEPSRGTTK